MENVINRNNRSKIRSQISFVILLTIIGILIGPYQLKAQASLAAENTIDDITITTKHGKQKVYTVYQDARVRTQWYYPPNEFRVAEEIDANGKVRPKMTILRYQYQDVITKENKEGGVLVAAFTYAIEPEAVDQVRKEIMRRKGISNVTLSAMPLRTSTIDFLSSSGEFIGDVDAKVLSTPGATSASQEMVISFNLTTLGASVFAALASSNGGIPIRGNITYNGLSAPCGYIINGKWDNVYSYFEEKSAIEAGGFLGIFGAKFSRTKQKVREGLENMKDMKVEVIECPSTASEAESDAPNSDDANMQALIKKIQEEVFSKDLMDRVSELAKLESVLKTTTDDETKKKIVDMIIAQKDAIRAGYQKSIKDVKKRSKGEINYDFSRQKMIIRSTSVGGLLSFSKYGLDEESLVKDGYIIDIDANRDFPSVIIGLPNLNPDFDLRTVTLEVSYTNSDGNTHSEARQWNNTKGWVTPTGKEAGYIRFNLIGEKDVERIKEPEFSMRLQVVSGIPNASFVIDKKTQLTTGERYVDAIELLTQQVIIDGSSLDFASITKNQTDLAIAKLRIKKGNVSINKDIKPFRRDGVAGSPNPIYILFPNDNSPRSGEIIFIRNDGNRIPREEPIELGENTLGNYEWRIGVNE